MWAAPWLIGSAGTVPMDRDAPTGKYRGGAALGMKRAGRTAHPTFATRRLPGPMQELSALVTGIDTLDRRERESEREGVRVSRGTDLDL